MTQLYDLKYKPRRSQGLTAGGYKGPRLLETISCPTSPSSGPDEMPPRASGRLATKAPSKVMANDSPKKGKSVDASPESSSDEDDAAPAADIHRTVFGKRSKSPTPDGRDGQTKKATFNGTGTQPSRNEQAKVSPSSSSRSKATKRKNPASQEDRWIGRSMVDPFGRVVQKKKAKSGYGSGSSQPRVTSSQSAPKSKKPGSSPPATHFQKFDLQFELHSSPIDAQDVKSSPGKQILLKPDDIGSSPAISNTPTEKFTMPVEFENSPTSTPTVGIGFQMPEQAENFSVSDSKDSESFTDPVKLKDTPTSTPPSIKGLIQRSPNAVPLKRDSKKLLDLKNYDLAGDLASRVQNIVGQEESGANSGDMFEEDFDTSMTVEARCPLCKQPCDVSELNKWGSMNTRQQEKFCRSHRKTTAEKRWNRKGYPEIDWEKLESRILGHHDFIKNLLNGAECHYRKAFEDLVAAGKGRSIRKMESNLIPGYYGSRGLNMISEHVISEFAEPLSERSVNDGLISKRGTTAFVQSVIVPEVTVRLIMEDMFIDDEEARNVLTESSNIGELVHEEIKDVVVERAEDSDDDNDWNENEHSVAPRHVAGAFAEIKTGI